MKKRIDKARNYLKGLDAILISSRETVTYLSGYAGSDAELLFTESAAILFVDSRNTIQARQESCTEVFEVSRKWSDIRGYMKSLNIKTLGIESNIIDLDTFLQLKDIFEGVEMTPIGKQLRYIRAVKDASEIEAMKEAARISEDALETVISRGMIGRREIDVAFDMEYAMRRLGASAVSFDIIVASGPRSAMPHGIASDRIIGADEPVLIDFGCRYHDYCSDQTVTMFTGEPDNEFRQVYSHVFEAQNNAINALCAGVNASYIDSLARGHLESKGVGAFFRHGLGHGVGMEIHEMPTISPISQDRLKEGMVLTIEPGVYFTDNFGIRLEDTLLVTDNSCQRITNIDKEALKIIS